MFFEKKVHKKILFENVPFVSEQAQYNGQMNEQLSSPADYLGTDSSYGHIHSLCDGIPASPDGSCCNNGGVCSDKASEPPHSTLHSTLLST